MKVLLVEDNHALAAQVAEFLCAHKWQVDCVNKGLQAVELASSQIFDVIILDLNLPDRDGLDVCQQIKRNAFVNQPIIMVTARDSFNDKAAGFHQGADDYLTKPFDLRELVLRCEALARRHQLHQSQELALGDLTLDLASQIAMRNNQQLSLTNIGFKILRLLMESYPKPISRSLLTHKLWEDEAPDSDALKSHIYSLRQALDKPFAQPMLKTVLNVGYKLEVVENECV